MFNFQTVRVSCMGVLSLLMLLFTGTVAVAQSGINPPPDEAFWHLRTDPATRSTLVQFYDPEHRLFYQEKLAQKYLKVTPRTVRMLNRTLARLLQVHDRNLVASQMKSARMFAGAGQSHETVAEKPPLIPWADNAPEAPLMYRTAVQAAEGESKVIVRIANPGRARVYIRLEEENPDGIFWSNPYLYFERTSLPRYLRSINLSRVRTGIYRLYITQGPSRKYYRVYISEGKTGKTVKVLDDRNS